MIQLEHDYQGQDYNINIKGINPSPLNLTGIYVGSYLQSVSKNLALGVEALYQRPTPQNSELALSYLAKYTSTEKNCSGSGGSRGSSSGGRVADAPTPSKKNRHRMSETVLLVGIVQFFHSVSTLTLSVLIANRRHPL